MSTEPAVQMCPCGCEPLATLHERGFTVANLPDEERLAALETIERLLRLAEQDARALDGREHNQARFDEAYRLIELLRAQAS